MKSNFRFRDYYLLCFSETFGLIPISVILVFENYLSIPQGIGLWVGINLIGYTKYLYQKSVSKDYINVSIYLYLLAWLVISCVTKNPLYFLLFSYPFYLLYRIEDKKGEQTLSYANMRDRQILYDEYSIALHSVDHLMHGMISTRLLLLYFYPIVFVTVEPFLISFVLLMSDVLFRLQANYLYQPKRKS